MCLSRRVPYERRSTKSLSASVTRAVMVVPLDGRHHPEPVVQTLRDHTVQLLGLFRRRLLHESLSGHPSGFPSSTGPGSHCHRHNLSISSLMASISCWAVLSRPSSTDFPSMAVVG